MYNRPYLIRNGIFRVLDSDYARRTQEMSLPPSSGIVCEQVKLSSFYKTRKIIGEIRG